MRAWVDHRNLGGNLTSRGLEWLYTGSIAICKLLWSECRTMFVWKSEMV